MRRTRSWAVVLAFGFAACGGVAGTEGLNGDDVRPELAEIAADPADDASGKADVPDWLAPQSTLLGCETAQFNLGGVPASSKAGIRPWGWISR